MNLLRGIAFHLALLATGVVAAEDVPKLETSPKPDPGREPFTLEGIRVDPRERTVSFLAKVNMVEGLVEYFLVHAEGKTHESVFSTEIRPVHLHAAILLLGAKGATPKENSAAPSSVVTSLPPETPALTGDRVRITVSWSGEKGARQVAAEDLILNQKTREPMSQGDWVYNGSGMYRDQFLAEEVGSIIALVSDPEALINNPRPGRNDDQNWSANLKKLLPQNSSVEIAIALIPLSDPSR